MSVRVKLDNRERGYYASLYQAADAANSGQIGGAQAVAFFKRSGLPIDILKKIWLASSPNNQTLNKEEFYIALKLISYAQNNIDVSIEQIQRGIASPLPQFQSDTEEVYRLRPEQERLYQNYVQSLDHTNHTVSTQLAMNLFQKTPLSQSQLQNIINLIDPQLSTKARMGTHCYIVIAHLISLSSQGVAIPQKLPHSLQEYLNLEVIPSQKQAVVPKSNDLLAFETNLDKAKSPNDKYSAFNNLDIPAPIIEIQTTTQQNTQPLILSTSQSFKIQSTNPQAPVLRQQKSIDLMMSDLDGQQLQQVVAPIQPLMPVQVIQPGQQLPQTPKQQADFSKQNLMQEQILIQQQQFESSLRQTNDLLNEFRDQHEKMLISTQSQLESLQTANEQYKTILKKISDENDLFQEELKQIEVQKKKLTETLSKQAIEINQKFGINIHLKQEYTKQSMGAMNTVNECANSIIGDLKSQYEIDQDKKRRQDQEIIKELKGQKEQIHHLTEQVSLLVKDMKSQRKNSVPYTSIDTHEAEQQLNHVSEPFGQPINNALLTFQKGGESKKLFEADNQAFLLQEVPLQQFEVKPIIENQQLLWQHDFEQSKGQTDNLMEINLQQQQFEDTEKQEVALSQDHCQEETIQPQTVIEANQFPISVQEQIEEINEKVETPEQQVEAKEELNISENTEPKLGFEETHQQDFNFKFEDGFGEHFANRGSIEKDQNPSLAFDQNFGQTISFGFDQVATNEEVHIEFDANKEFGAKEWGFQDNFVKGSPQQQEDFSGFKW